MMWRSGDRSGDLRIWWSIWRSDDLSGDRV